MRARVFRVLASMAIGWICGCSDMRGQPFNPGLTGGEYYLCCSTRFSPDLRATDANYGNYAYREGSGVTGPILAAGTRVRVVKVGSSAIQFEPATGGSPYTLIFRYGKNQQTPDQYFRNILLPTDPTDALKEAPRGIVTAIQEGRLAEGMTREQALMARGYPPAHRTPNLDANEWIYYETPGFVDRVAFSDGKILSVTRGPAPE